MSGHAWPSLAFFRPRKLFARHGAMRKDVWESIVIGYGWPDLGFQNLGILTLWGMFELGNWIDQAKLKPGSSGISEMSHLSSCFIGVYSSLDSNMFQSILDDHFSMRICPFQPLTIPGSRRRPYRLSCVAWWQPRRIAASWKPTLRTRQPWKTAAIFGSFLSKS